MTAHVMVEVLKRYVDNGTDNAGIVLSVLQTEWKDDVFYVFVNGFFVYVLKVIFEIAEICHGNTADVALEVSDVNFDGVVAEFVVDD